MPLTKINNTEKDIYILVAAELGTVTTLKLLKNYEWDIPKIFSDILSKDDRYKRKIKLPDAAVLRLRENIRTDVDGEIAKYTADGVRMISLQSNEYPKYLRKISNPPLALFVKGELPSNLDTAVAIVGSRSVSDDGQLKAHELGAAFAKNNIPVVSGMAIGVDGAAQNGVISAGGKTVAVLGSGVKYIYPPKHTDLYYNILNGNGAIVSELTPDKSPTKISFPIRNRIISGMAKSLVVIEPRVNSGAMITLDYAVKQGKIIYVMPKYGVKMDSDEEAFYYDRGIMIVADVKTLVDSYLLNHELLTTLPQIEQKALKEKQLSLKNVVKSKKTSIPKEKIQLNTETQCNENDYPTNSDAKRITQEKNDTNTNSHEKVIEKSKKADKKSEPEIKGYIKPSKKGNSPLSARLSIGTGKVYDLLSIDKPKSVESILNEIDIDITELMSILLVLELNGTISEIAPDLYILTG